MAADVTPPTVTVTGTVPVPGGAASMMSLAAVPLLTVAGFPGPKSTVLLAAVAEKPDPVIVTLFPPAGRPETGEMVVMVGGPAAAAVPALTNVNAAPIVPRQRASATRPFTNLRNSATTE
jgi:hypothetical protein